MAQFNQIYEQYARPVYRFLLTLTGDENQAEELLQETFYQALVHIDRFEGRSSLYTWLCQIGKNAWLRECRRSRRQAGESWEEPTAPSAEARYLDREELRELRKAVLELEEPYKEVFILHTWGGLKLKEIAQSYGKSESWARVTYYRARKKIAEEVTK